MLEFPTIAIGVITFNRPEEIRRTILALIERVRYVGDVVLVIADDCSEGRYLRDLEQWWADGGHHWRLKTLPTPRNSGWGVNANNLLRYVFDVERIGLLVQMEDDYVLRHTLDLNAGVAVMQQEPQLGMLRYRATAGTPMLYYQRETDISPYYPDYREYWGYTLGRATWLELLPNSPTLWLYSNGPHLKRREFHDLYGMYPEGQKLGMTEESYAHVVKDMMLVHPGTPKIGVMPEWVYMHWDHIGVSYQHTEFDR